MFHAPFDPTSISVVVPVFDEEENIARLVSELHAALHPLGRPFELVVVDDGSRDGTLAALRRAALETPELVVVALRRNYGQTLALQAGLDRARGAAIVTLDGDLQNDPADIPRLLDRLAGGADVVSGWRRARQDAWLSRKLPSLLANRLTRFATGVPIRDQGCSLKAYRREVVQRLDLWGDMHRFIATWTLPLGARIEEVPVNHRARQAGTSKYGLSRTFAVLADLTGMQLLLHFRERPLRGFARMGVPFALLALAATLGLAFAGGHFVVPAAVSFLGASTFGACLLLGLLGEAALEGGPNRGRRVRLCREWEVPR